MYVIELEQSTIVHVHVDGLVKTSTLSIAISEILSLDEIVAELL